MTGSSALMAIAHIFLCYVLFLSFNKPFGHGAPLVKSKPHATPSLCSGPEHGLRVVHKYAPCTPLGRKKSASSQILAEDERRVQVRYTGIYNRRPVWGKGEPERDPDVLKGSIGAGNYLVQVRFGTPLQTFNLTLDTGSYKTWVRCQPPTMSPCPKQQNASLYYPSCSSTYSNATCSTPPCNNHDEENYMDNSGITGTYVADTLRIEDGDEYEIPKFVFLCVYHEKGEFEDANGILGLGLSGTSHGNYALTTQTAAMFHKVFCHCLPTSANSDGYVYFGEEAREKCPFSGSYTPLLSSPSGHDPSFYYVNLISITIGQKRVNISSSVSSPRTILDSGTVITRLPSSVYSVLRSEFRGLMSEYPPVSTTPSHDNVLDTCYNLKEYNNPVIPKMVLHFENLDLDLDQTAVTWTADDTSQVCFAFAESKEDGLTIIGNHQQQKRNILYNVPEQRVEIGHDNC
ncbi:hypothetical protein V6N13_002227 [Hibiscus sabdariffa]|uniref:Peptidase A1 domain-containing protein n=1 Tax=Hibiscus sabdariffa TaxID=183260 RepID=A0ABR2C3R5_9ROSI